MKRQLFIPLLIALLLAPALAAARQEKASEAKKLVSQAADTFTNFMSDREFTWFHAHLRDAKALLIFPRVIKAGFFWGGSGGNGVLVVRDEKTGEWSQPAFYTVGSVSFGLQAGGQEAEMIMFAMSRKAIDSLYASSFRFGGDIAVAAGPRGVGAKRALTADFVSFAKAKGLYAGLDFEGSGVKVRDDLNKAYYGKEVRPIEIVLEKKVSSPESDTLLDALGKRIAF